MSNASEAALYMVEWLRKRAEDEVYWVDAAKQHSMVLQLYSRCGAGDWLMVRQPRHTVTNL